MSTGSDNVVGISLEINKTANRNCQYASFWAAVSGISDELEWLLELRP